MTIVRTSRIAQKYTHPRAYFPDCCHGSTVSASISPEGLLELKGMLIRLSSVGVASRISRSVADPVSSRRSSATPARFANSSTSAGMLRVLAMLEGSCCGLQWRKRPPERRPAIPGRSIHCMMLVAQWLDGSTNSQILVDGVASPVGRALCAVCSLCCSCYCSR